MISNNRAGFQADPVREQRPAAPNPGPDLSPDPGAESRSPSPEPVLFAAAARTGPVRTGSTESVLGRAGPGPDGAGAEPDRVWTLVASDRQTESCSRSRTRTAASNPVQVPLEQLRLGTARHGSARLGSTHLCRRRVHNNNSPRLLLRYFRRKCPAETPE